MRTQRTVHMKTIQPGTIRKASPTVLPEGLKPLAVRFKTARAIIGVGKTKFHELINTGKIETVTIEGVRLAVYSSLERLVKDAA